MLITDYLDFCVDTYPTKLCLGQAQTRLNYKEFAADVGNVAGGLIDVGVRHGDRVAVLSENSIEQLALFFACAKLGAVYVPLNYRLAPQELAFILSDSAAKILFAGSEALAQVVDRIDGSLFPSSLETRVLSCPGGSSGGGWQMFEAFLGQSPSFIDMQAVKEIDTVYQMYTSGTTGLPKGVMISHQQLCHFIAAYHAMPPRRQMGEPHLAVAPLFHAAAFSLAVAALSCARPLIILTSFNPQEVLATIEQEQIVDTLLVPAMMNALVAEAQVQAVSLPSLKSITYGGSSIEPNQLKKAVEILGCEFQQGFGMTEMVSGLIWLTPDDHHRALAGEVSLLKSCGRPAPGTRVKIIDPETGNDLAINQVGEVLLQGGQMMQGYWKQPDKTTEALAGGWYHTGDAGCIDQEGYLYIKDRIKDMVVSGGENVYPAEVEAVLCSHPQVVESAVIGIPDEKYGEALVAVCVIKPSESFEAAQLIDYCRERIAGYKIPRKYHFVDALPRNAAGKILKRNLRNTYGAV
ncbi:long-chain-fatty-acid--CoA ligase [Aestuariicella hydrocarbonica]|uniref:Long-chain-fatty-acid--CoA ligase n=2 Tax=Pseudomaricurvus hydrocarbonicus TaxID=1470433 RepID=A0A9E5MLV5_9GAMM|nr:long-chain-fatty-acid--CoA ligase [Aestuariicella hydrocarbonica]